MIIKRYTACNPRVIFLALLVLVLVSFTLPAQNDGVSTLPRPRGYVSDFAGVISADAAAQIESIAETVQSRTGAEIAVVTVESFEALGYATISEFGIALAEAWGVGGSDNDTGVILILALQERQIRLEVGYGLEGALPDGRAGAIIDQAMVPAFQAQRFGEGFLAATRMVAGIIGEETGVDLSDAGARAAPARDARRETGRSPGTDAGQIIIFLIVFILFGGGRFIFWPLMFGRFRRGFYGGGFGTHYRGYRGGGSFRGGSGFGGGFGGFGGGGFGGGGASRGF